MSHSTHEKYEYTEKILLDINNISLFSLKRKVKEFEKI